MSDHNFSLAVSTVELQQLMEALQHPSGHMGFPGPASDRPEWLGVLIGDECLAVPITQLGAVFSSQKKIDIKSKLDPLDVEVHAGTPVFLTPISHLLRANSTVAPTSSLPDAQRGDWILTVKTASAGVLGCRVDGIRGPFAALPENDSVQFEGRSWSVWVAQDHAHE